MKKKEKCVTCSTTSNDCVECSEGWYPLDHECTECSTNNCATCDSTNGNCKTCNEDRYYEENKCKLCNEIINVSENFNHFEQKHYDIYDKHQ